MQLRRSRASLHVLCLLSVVGLAPVDPHKMQHVLQIRVPSKLDNTEYLTQNNGTPIYNNNNSTTVGLRGPVLYDDMHLVNKLGQFNREKIPERVVHARGMTAKGWFEVFTLLLRLGVRLLTSLLAEAKRLVLTSACVPTTCRCRRTSLI